MQDVYAAIHKGGLWLGPRFQAGCFTCTFNNISRGRHLCRSSIPGNGDGSGYATKRFCPEVCKQMQRMRTGPSGEGRRRAAVLSDVLLMVKTWTLNNSIPFRRDPQTDSFKVQGSRVMLATDRAPAGKALYAARYWCQDRYHVFVVGVFLV